jgi:Uma2 family endonuclease
MGFPEAALALRIGHLIQLFLDHNDLGLAAGADGMARLARGLVRIPDVSFVSWDQLPAREIPAEPILKLAPALAVEVLSKGNTEKEMARKLGEYFRAGVRLVWFVDPRTRTVKVYTDPENFVELTEGQTLGGGDVLPGLAIPVREIFARMPPLSSKPSRSEGSRPTRKRQKGKSDEAV